MFHNKLLSRAAMIAVVCSAFAPVFAHAGVLDLSRYQLSASFDAPRSESSAITYNWDTKTLFIAEDEGDFVSEITKTGTLVSEMRLNGFADTEGLTYVGGGQFVITDERVQTLSLINYTAGGSASKATAPTYSFGPNVGNVGIEGVSYDPATGKFIAVKQESPQKVYEATIDFFATPTTGSHVELFDPALLGLLTVSDVQVLSMFDGSGFEENLLVLSAASELLLEVTRTGQILSSLSLAGLPGLVKEGVTIDENGTIYIAAEGSGPEVIFAFNQVPEPGTALLLLGGLAGLGLHSRRRRQDKPSILAAA